MLGTLVASQTEANHADLELGTPCQARDFLPRERAWRLGRLILL
jgi:hypothetical protein